MPGGALYEDRLVHASHAYHPERNPVPYLGHLLVEPKRHVLGLGGLTDDEAAAVGRVSARLARALGESEGAEHVYLLIVGHHSPHLHLPLVPRYPGTPREFWDPLRLDEWAGAKHGGPDEVAELAARVRAAL